MYVLDVWDDWFHTKLNCSHGNDLLGRGISGLPIPGPYGNTMRLRHWTGKRGFYGKCVWELVANLATNEISFSFPNLSSSHHSEDQGSTNGLNLVTSHINISINNSTAKIPLTGLLNKNITFQLYINNKHNNNPRWIATLTRWSSLCTPVILELCCRGQ